jgi:hypothetical protein
MNREGGPVAVRATAALFPILIAVAFITAGVLIVMSSPGCGCAGPSPPPIGTFDEIEVVDPSSVTVQFGQIDPQQKPMKLEIVLEKNGVTESRYWFVSNKDRELLLRDGEDIGTLTYADLADNQMIDVGDMLLITNLESGSDFTITMKRMITGDPIASKAFSTPSGHEDI